MTMGERYTYRSIVRDLTTPLVDAYRSMIQLQLRITQDRIPPTCNTLPAKTTRQVRLLFHQGTQATVMPGLPLPHRTQPTSAFTYSDAAFGLTDADIGILHDPITY